jgi:hypothetical protein
MCATRSIRSNLFKTSAVHCGKRFTHRAADFIYLTKGSKYSHYYSGRVKNGAEIISSSHSSLFSAYLRTSATMAAKGKVPFVHGQSASWNVAFRFTQCLSSRTFGYFKFLRPPSTEYRIERQELEQRIESFIKKHGNHSWTHGVWGPNPSRLDEDQNIRPHLMSMSYALMGNCTKYESAFFFTFSNEGILDQMQTWDASEKVIRNALRVKSVTEKNADFLVSELKSCFEEYSSLKRGNLVLIGIPKDKLSYFAYDSKAWGIPTGTPIEKVVENPMLFKQRLEGEEGGFQVRLRIFKQTLDPKSGIDVILANDGDEVDAYCSDTTLTAPENVDAYRPFIAPVSKEEKEEQVKRANLDARVKALAFEAKRVMSS